MGKKVFFNFAEFAIVLCILTILNLAETSSGLRPFALGFFVAIIFVKRNFIISSFAYVICVLILDFSIAGAIVAVSPPVVLTLAYYVHKLIKRPVGMIAVNVYAFLSQIPSIVFAGYTIGLYVTLLNVISAQMFCYCAVTVIFAVVSRRLKLKLTVDEIISGAVVIGALALGLYHVEFYGFRLAFTVIAFVTLLLGYVAGIKPTFIVALSSGVGICLSGAPLSIVGALVLWSVAAVAFKHLNNSIVTAVTLVSFEAILGFYFNAYGEYGLVNLAAVAVGAICFVALSAKTKKGLKERFDVLGGGYSARYTVNRSRTEISRKLKEVSSAFSDVELNLERGITSNGNLFDASLELSKRVEQKFCEHCDERNRCEKILGDKNALMYELSKKALENGKLRLADIPTYLTSICSRAEKLYEVINDKTEEYISAKRVVAEIDKGKELVIEQIKGIRELLTALAEEIEKNLQFDADKESRVIDELARNGILCVDALVYGGVGEYELTLTVDSKALAKTDTVIKVADRVFKQKFAVKTGKVTAGVRYVPILLVPAPEYDLVCGERHTLKPESLISGDVKSVTRINEVKCVVTLCDGMGSGTDANNISNLTVSMLESLYKAGFKNETTLSVVNRLLSIGSDEMFSALDVVTVDLRRGECDLLKMAACPTFIKTADGVEMVEGSALPIGIVDNIKPSHARRRLKEGDMLLMVSDGVIDALGTDSVYDYVYGATSMNPQELCNTIIDRATCVGGNDDMSAVCVRLFRRFNN